MKCLDVLESLMREHGATCAGLVIEPLLQGAGGMIVQPPGFLRRVRELCDRYGLLMIADEVATGFGRTGRMFACDHEGVVPDIMALSKGIAAGYLPLAVTVTTGEVYGAFLGQYAELKTFFHGHTFTGNPLATARYIGQQMGVDAVMLTLVSRYTERDGGDYSVNQPASVSFKYQLIHVPTGKELCMGVFDETQQTLLSNLFSFSKASSRGFKWVKAEQLTREGLNEKLNDCQYLTE